MSNAPRSRADDNFALKLKELGIESAEFGFTFIRVEDPKFQPFRDAFAEYRREFAAEFAPQSSSEPEEADDLHSWLIKMEPKLIYLNCVHPDERTKCPIRPVDLQFCREAWGVARLAGVRFREATRLDLKTADDELDYLTGLKVAIEDHQTIVPTLHTNQSAEARLIATPIPAVEREDAEKHAVVESGKTEQYATLMISLKSLANDQLIGKQRRIVELLVEAEGRKRIADIATDAEVDWDKPYKTGIDGFKRGIKPKVMSYGAAIVVVDQELRIVFADDVPRSSRRPTKVSLHVPRPPERAVPPNCSQ
ncbi:MAG TPA: hypothetical protein VGM98_21690 [Schlesneria sp.]|jgi:hypothetical protein